MTLYRSKRREVRARGHRITGVLRSLHLTTLWAEYYTKRASIAGGSRPYTAAEGACFYVAPRVLPRRHTFRQKWGKLHYRVCSGHNNDPHADHAGETIRGECVKWVVRQTQLFRLHPPRGARVLMGSINSTRQVRRFWDCFTKQLALPKQIVSMLSTWLRRFPISFEQPKIGSPNSRLRSACIRRKPSARSSGYIECILRLRTDFSDKTTVVEDRLNAGKSTVRVDWRVELKEGGDRPLASPPVR